MSDSFEQQVAEALVDAVPVSDADNEWWWHERIREHLAPRVAAAIQAAGRFNPHSKNLDGALSALRGETP